MSESSLSSALNRVNSVREKYIHVFEFNSAVMSNATNQMHSSFSKARYELGLLRLLFGSEISQISSRDFASITELIDQLLSDLTKQESQYWFALSLVHVAYGTSFNSAH